MPQDVQLTLVGGTVSGEEHGSTHPRRILGTVNTMTEVNPSNGRHVVQMTFVDGPTDPLAVGQELPEFATAIRGYDRAQVDDYISRLQGWLDEADGRTRAAEKETLTVKQELSSLEERASLPTPRYLTAFAQRVSQILEQAVAAAEALRDETDREAEGIRSVAMADREGLLITAQSEARQIIDAARSEERTIQQEISNLAATRDAALAYLGELQTRLAELVHGPDATSRVAIDHIAENTNNDEEVAELFDQEAQSSPDPDAAVADGPAPAEASGFHSNSAPS